jgi:hypothetical protein
MASSTIKKGPLTLNGNELTIFGNSGFVHGKNWVVNFGFNVEVEPAPASPEIVSVIENDFKDGNGEKIHHVQVNPNTALRLFLEGKIKRDDVEKATVTEESVTFQAVEFEISEGETRAYPVVVLPKPVAKIATIDEAGNIV